MKIDDIESQREKAWFIATITYITVGDATHTKPDRNDFDQQKQLVYFVDEDDKKDEMTVYVPDTPQGLEPISTDTPPGTRAVFRIKRIDDHLIGILTDRKPSEPENKAEPNKWDAIAEGKCRDGKINAEIRKNGILSMVVLDTNNQAKLNKRKLLIANELAKFSITGEIT